ncbi:TIGR03564 family F420-dependent LLM class oxidoreductase [Pseudonocardia sp.]|uniref:TIGR03564 family F420-dependent LLM class oxidoreductase n=1 Tax=Pseudonocardia sp. TaxID=60912 RepID=UPI003D09A9D3
MRIAVTIGGEAIGSPVPPAEAVEEACRAEAEGFASAWSVHFSRGTDALSVLAAAGVRTSRIDLGVGVIPTYPRHPLALAQQAMTVQALCGGRLTLGVGVSHRPVIEDLHGLSYTSPAEHLRDYLSVLVPLVRTGKVTHRGRYYRVDGAVHVPDTRPVPVLVGALGPRMVEVAGELSDGVVTWLAGPRSLTEVIVPRLPATARVVAAIPVCVSVDEAGARARAETVFARYGQLENYQRQFEREGLTSVGEFVVAGDEDTVAARLRSYSDAGTTELWAVPFGDDEDVRRTRAALAAWGGT